MTRNPNTFAASFETYIILFNVAEVAQLVRASDCGSEGHRFETYLRYKRKQGMSEISAMPFLLYHYVTEALQGKSPITTTPPEP